MTKAAIIYAVLCGNVLLATRCYEDYRASYREPPQWVQDASYAVVTLERAVQGREPWRHFWWDVEVAIENCIRWLLGEPPIRDA